MINVILTLEEAREELLSLYEVYFAPNFYSLGTPEYRANVIKQIRRLEMYIQRTITNEFNKQF